MRIFLLLALLIACLLPGCSGSVCQDACEKQKRCAQDLNCAQLPDNEKPACQSAKNLFANEDCSEIKTCAGVDKERAQELNGCELSKFCGDCKITSGDGPPRSDIFCRQPDDISKCFAPPNQRSQTLWWCSGCGDCEGSTKTAACSLFSNDCRYFATSCIPRTYGFCDGRGSDQLQFLCGYCFFRDGSVGTVPKDCDKLSDFGAAKPKDASAKQ
jgi:hypothetical protein